MKIKREARRDGEREPVEVEEKRTKVGEEIRESERGEKYTMRIFCLFCLYVTWM